MLVVGIKRLGETRDVIHMVLPHEIGECTFSRSAQKGDLGSDARPIATTFRGSEQVREQDQIMLGVVKISVFSHSRSSELSSADSRMSGSLISVKVQSHSNMTAARPCDVTVFISGSHCGSSVLDLSNQVVILAPLSHSMM